MNSNPVFRCCACPKLCLGVTSVTDLGFQNRLVPEFALELSWNREMGLKVCLHGSRNPLSNESSLDCHLEYLLFLDFPIALIPQFLLKGIASLVDRKLSMLPVIASPPFPRATHASGSPCAVFPSPRRLSVQIGGGIISQPHPTPGVLQQDVFFMPGGRRQGLCFPRRNNQFPRLP